MAMQEPRVRLLVVEDDPQTAAMAERLLQRHGYLAAAVTSAVDAMRVIGKRWPDLVVLDMRLVGLDGTPLCRWVREGGRVPVVMISPSADEHDRVWALDIGADDVVPSPLSPQELVARVKAVLRRSPPRDEATSGAGEHLFAAGPLELDAATRRVRVRGAWVVLTALEFALLDFFARHPDTAFHRRELLERVWGHTVGDASTVTVHVRRLRMKIEPDPARPTSIVTVWGAGYRFDPSGGRDHRVEP